MLFLQEVDETSGSVQVRTNFSHIKHTLVPDIARVLSKPYFFSIYGLLDSELDAEMPELMRLQPAWTIVHENFHGLDVRNVKWMKDPKRINVIKGRQAGLRRSIESNPQFLKLLATYRILIDDIFSKYKNYSSIPDETLKRASGIIKVIYQKMDKISIAGFIGFKDIEYSEGLAECFAYRSFEDVGSRIMDLPIQRNNLYKPYGIGFPIWYYSGALGCLAAIRFNQNWAIKYQADLDYPQSPIWDSVPAEQGSTTDYEELLREYIDKVTADIAEKEREWNLRTI